MSKFSPLQPLLHKIFEEAQIRVFVKRDDLIHPIISGNKWRKLKYNLASVKKHNKAGVISFGGAYSNHIHALAYACQVSSIPCIAIIRGEAHYADNATLSMAQRWGMQLRFVDRKTYRLRHDSDFLSQLTEQYPNFEIIPEGGTNPLALDGVGEVINELDQQLEYDTIITPVGSAGTISGLIKADNNRHEILGISVLKGAQYLAKEITQLTSEQYSNWQLMHEHHLGGYAKFSKQDAHKILSFSQESGVLFEPVYSGKMLLALLSLIEQNYFKPGQRIVLLHTGGLQGINGLKEQKRLNDQWPWQLEQ